MCRTKMPLPRKKPPWKKIYAALPFVCKYCRGLFPDFKFYKRHIRSHESRYKKFWHSREWQAKRRYSTSYIDDVEDDGYQLDEEDTVQGMTDFKRTKFQRRHSYDPEYLKKSGARSGRYQGAVSKGPRGGYTPRGITVEQAALIARYQRMQLSKHKAPERFEYDSEDNMDDDDDNSSDSYHDVVMRNVGALFIQQLEQCKCKDCFKPNEHVHAQNRKTVLPSTQTVKDSRVSNKQTIEQQRKQTGAQNRQIVKNSMLQIGDANQTQKSKSMQKVVANGSVGDLGEAQPQTSPNVATSASQTMIACPHCPVSFDHPDRLVLHIQNHYRLAKTQLADGNDCHDAAENQSEKRQIEQHRHQRLPQHQQQLSQLRQQQQLEQLQRLHIAQSASRQATTKVTATAAQNLPLVHQQVQQPNQQQNMQPHQQRRQQTQQYIQLQQRRVHQQEVDQPPNGQQVQPSQHQHQKHHIQHQHHSQQQKVQPSQQQHQQAHEQHIQHQHQHHSQQQQQEFTQIPVKQERVSTTAAKIVPTQIQSFQNNGHHNVSNNNNTDINSQIQSLITVVLKCPDCVKTFTSETDLKVHQLYHQSPVAKDYRIRKHSFELVEDTQSQKPYSCSYCPKMFTYWSSLKTHEFTHTGDPPFACNVCDEKFTQSSDMKLHERTHFNANSFKCGKCGRLFKHRPSLTAHENSHHGEDGKNVCPVCLKNFSVGSNLRDHLRIHTGERPYECASCGRGFIQKSHLRKHVMIHTGERPFKCTFCSKGFTQRGDVRRHEKIHQKVK